MLKPDKVCPIDCVNRDLAVEITERVDGNETLSLYRSFAPAMQEVFVNQNKICLTSMERSENDCEYNKK